MIGGSSVFIDGAWRAVRGDYGEIIEWLSMVGDLEDSGDKIWRYHLENKP